MEPMGIASAWTRSPRATLLPHQKGGYGEEPGEVGCVGGTQDVARQGEGV